MANMVKEGFNLLILIALVGALWFVLVWTGIIACSAVPGGCDIYYAITRGGPPKILIVYGEGGMGDHELLASAMTDPQILGVRPRQMELDRITRSLLKDYDMVIVEEAREMGTDKMKMLIDYAAEGGRLIWTGDAGSVPAPGDTLLLHSQRGDQDENIAIGPWARAEWKTMVPLDEFISVNYLANYCEVASCEKGQVVGSLETEPGRDHKLVYGVADGLPMYGNFTIVRHRPGSNSRIVMWLDYGSKLEMGDGEMLGEEFPIIVASGVGEKIVYYAVPPEQFLSEDKPKQYYLFLENLVVSLRK